jgi:ABC-type multidrug transport system fused ATPase/permease subunit
MDDLIQRPRSFLSKRKGQLADKGIATAYDLFAKFSLPIAVVFYGLELSLTNHAVLAERLGALSQCLMNLGRQVIVQDNGDQIVSTYYKCIQLGVEPTGKQKTLVDARIEDLTVDGSESWEIEFRGVSFAYPQTQSADTTEIKSNEKQSPPDFVLEDFNFKFERGKTYGIVGHNGRGKTTLVQLLAGLYTPTKGQIFINGIDMQRFNISDLRTKMSILFQDFAKYHDLSVLENIFMGNITNDITLATQRAAETGVNFVPLDSVLYNLSKRPKHPDETWQTQLSGGQWQKIALARAFMRIDAELLVLDEPTSALDIESEHKLFKMILAKRQGKTTIFVTHKLNTTRIADCVLFIKDGKVCEAGSHDELIALNGEYARLWRIQSTGYDELVESME